MTNICESLVGQLTWVENLITEHNRQADQLWLDIQDIDRNLCDTTQVSVALKPPHRLLLNALQVNEGPKSSSSLETSACLLMQLARASFSDQLTRLEGLLRVENAQAGQLWMDIKALDQVIQNVNNSFV